MPSLAHHVSRLRLPSCTPSTEPFVNSDRFKDQHAQILDSIEKLRCCSRAGIIEHADQIAQLIVSIQPWFLGAPRMTSTL
jgi:hypothetical protein